MTIHRLYREQFVPRPLTEVFAFFEKPENLATITPPSLGFRILTPSPIRMRKGAIIDYTIQVGGLPLRWRTLIRDYDPPHRFVDEQVKGPYALWHHTHSFVAVDGGTIIQDEVYYGVRFGIIGRLMGKFFVKRQLGMIFDHRSRIIENMFAGRKPLAGHPAGVREIAHQA